MDGDGKKEMVAAAKDSGLWLLRPGADPQAELEGRSSIDADSKGFEHAALLDRPRRRRHATSSTWRATNSEVRRYVWDGKASRAR